MKKTISIHYQEITDFQLLSDLDKKLIDRAIDAMKHSYSSYSNFSVGAALILENNQIIIGSNQENASFPCGICAERVALFSASTNFPNLLMKKIAITAKSKNFEIKGPVGPCGLCRQVLLEYEEKQNINIEILLFNNKKIIKLASAKDLLPLFFQENKLKNQENKLKK
jgi:cytidine deaminase